MCFDTRSHVRLEQGQNVDRKSDIKFHAPTSRIKSRIHITQISFNLIYLFFLIGRIGARFIKILR
jgi:hypothetical protein